MRCQRAGKHAARALESHDIGCAHRAFIALVGPVALERAGPALDAEIRRHVGIRTRLQAARAAGA
ncbi:hypothetical protein UB46_23970, partial [Burkholderiaceae bacterium 16]